MRFYMVTALMGLTLTGCHKDDDKGADDSGPVGTDDSATDDDSGTVDSPTDSVEPPCETTVLEVSPETGTADVYHRDQLSVSFSEDGSAALIEIRDATGAVVDADVSWSEGNVKAFLDTVLEPSSEYTLHVEVCDVTTESSFTTSNLGEPLSVDPTTLLDNTYQFRLSNDADITEPVFLDAMAASYLNVPLLFGIVAVDATSLQLMGALGEQQNSGDYTQQTDQDVWEFPPCDFTTAPFFSTVAEYITLTYQGYEIPVEHFTLEGTFVADGSSIREGYATGNVDSRNLGSLLNQPDNPSAICDIAYVAGVSCIPCSDGEPYCLYMVAENITAELAEGLVLVDPNAEEPE